MSIRSARYRNWIFICGVVLSLSFGCGGGGGTTYTVSKNTIGAPSSISAVAGNGSVTVSWSSVTGATSYNIYSSLSSTVSKTTGTKHIVSGTTFIDTGLTNGFRYYYVMTSVKSGIESSDSSVVSAVPGTTGSISGKITYEDKELGANLSIYAGYFTGSTTLKAVRYATVDVVNATNSGILYTTLTNSLGMYSIPTSTGSTTVYIRVHSEALPTGGIQPITVMNLSNAIYGVPSTNFTLAGSANVNITIPTTNIAAGAFNILDVMTAGYDFVKSLSGSYPPVPLDVFWALGNTDGTYYCSGGCLPGDGIYVFNQTGGDTDEYDDDVLWHEFGHFVASTYSLDDSPGGIHYLGADDQDLRLSWSEGWGNFFPGAIKIWLSSTGQSNLISSAAGVSLTTYVDTSAVSDFSFDFDNPPDIYSKYSSNEVAVAKLLTDLKNHYAIQYIWNVITDFRSNIPPITEPVNLELFWDRWLIVNIPDETQLVNLGIFYGDRSITYAIDGYEGDNIITTAKTYTAGFPQIHTLYATGDEDFIQFTATNATHTITTGNLINGADTFLFLYGPSQNLLWTNDNAVPPGSNPPNNATALSSRIQYSSFVPGQTYYVSVKSSTARPASAGKYGSYTLTISP